MASPFDRRADPNMFAEVAPPQAPQPLPDGQEFQQVKDTSHSSAPGDLEFDYVARVRGIIDDAREFNAEVLTPIREKGIQFYLGLIPVLEDEGRSTIVATEV